MQTDSPPFDRVGAAPPWYAQVWPWLLMLGPVIVIVAGSWTTWIAFSREDAMVVDDYYKQGKAINQDLGRDQVATALGMSFHASYDAASGKFHGTLMRRDVPAAERLRIRLVHATQPEKDLQLTSQSDARGEFSAALPMLEATRWQILVESEKGGWRLNGNWKWPQQKSIDIKADAPSAE